jgi:transglutaminase-like putative cysteine protease
MGAAQSRTPRLLLCGSLCISMCAVLGCSDTPSARTTASDSSEASAEVKDTGTIKPAGEYRLDAGLPYRAERSNPVTHEVDFRVVVTPPYHTKLLKVWLPLPQSDAGQEIMDSQLTTFPIEVTPRIGNEPVYGNRFAYFEFTNPQGAQIIRHRFRAKVWELRWNVEPANVQPVEQWPDSFAPYLRPQAISKQAEFQSLLRQLVPETAAPAHDLFTVMDWIDANLTYDHVHASLRADANHAFAERRGHCSDYHGLCTAMARSLGYPTRVTYGWSLFPKHSPSHCKMEGFLPGYGWVSFDVSETQRMVAKIGADKQLSDEEKQRLTAAARRRLKRGFRENSWLLLTKGPEFELEPKASHPVRVVRTIYAEADGEPLPDPDPANQQKREFAWMTAHQYQADREFRWPFEDFSTLEGEGK